MKNFDYDKLIDLVIGIKNEFVWIDFLVNLFFNGI